MKSRIVRGSVVVVAAFAVVVGIASAQIVNKGSGTIGPAPSASSVSWQGDDVAAVTSTNQLPTPVGNQAGSDAHCNTAQAPPPTPGPRCDDFFVTVATPQPRGTLTVTVAVPAPEDYDLFIFDKNGDEVASSGNGNGQTETASVPCPSQANGPYKVRIVYFSTLQDNQRYQANAAWADRTCLPQPVPTFDPAPLAFQASTLVSAHFLGGEPQVTMERHEPWTPQGAPVDANRIFVDWPLSSRSNIGQLNRSLDGGDSFRLLFDPTCAARSRPNCATGGGGDTENEVNLVNGTVFFADQEVLANEASASSTDHGDTWLLQTPVSNATTAVDRQWVMATDNAFKTPANQTIEGFFTYHTPPTAYVQAIPTDTHLPLPQPSPQLTNVGQSGQPRVDNNVLSPGHGWIYYPYRGYVLGAGVWVGIGPSNSYFNPLSWTQVNVSGQVANSFPWVSVDHSGNAYVTWDTNGSLFYSYAPIADPLNNPALGGHPGTLWSPPTKISPPGVTSAVFPENISGDNGRLAVVYVGTTECIQPSKNDPAACSGDPNNAETTVKWNTYAAVITNAASTTPTVRTGIVSHRVSHQGNICSHGTTCGLVPGSPEDRSLLDMIDVGFDDAGRLGVIFMDNYTNSFQNAIGAADLSPFDYFAKETVGPTLLAASPPVNLAVRMNSSTDATGDATWPNRQTPPAPTLPSLDATGASIGLGAGTLVGRLKLSQAQISQMQTDLTAYNAVPCVAPCQAMRLQYVLRFNTANEAYHMSLEVLPGGTTRAFGGKLDENDKIVNPASPTGVLGSGYHTDAGYVVTAQIQNGEIVFTAPAAQFKSTPADPGLATGTQLFSVTGFAMAGPSEQVEQTQTGVPQSAAYVMRTVDATPPFDATLANGPTAVVLRSLGARRDGRKVTLRWRTASEAGLAGFDVYRLSSAGRTKLNRRLIPASRRPGGASYAWRDTLPRGTRAACYRLQSVGLTGARRWLGRACATTR